MKENQASIKKINKEISGALKFWQDMLLIADADEWAYYLNYTEEDLLNALYIFNHVAQNIAIKKGYITESNVAEKMEKYREGVKEGFGFDTIELTNKVFETDGKRGNQRTR